MTHSSTILAQIMMIIYQLGQIKLNITSKYKKIKQQLFLQLLLAQSISTHLQLQQFLQSTPQQPMGKVLFPSRPKPADKDYNKNSKIDKQRMKQKKMFNNTIQDMRKMVEKHYGSYNKDTLGMLKTNTKVPYTHLMGRRNKIAERYSHQKARAREQGIQYDSNLQLLNSNIVEKSKKQKDEFLKNKYKFQGEKLNQGRLGRQSDGMLTISKKDLRRINGKQFQPKAQKQGRSKKSFKGKKVRKAGKGGKKPRKGGRKH